MATYLAFCLFLLSVLRRRRWDLPLLLAAGTYVPENPRAEAPGSALWVVAGVSSCRVGETVLLQSETSHEMISRLRKQRAAGQW